MVKDSVYYKFGPFEADDPGTNRTLIISAPDYGDYRFYAAFDPKWYLRFDEDLLLHYYKTWHSLPGASAWREGEVVIFENARRRDRQPHRVKICRREATTFDRGIWRPRNSWKSFDPTRRLMADGCLIATGTSTASWQRIQPTMSAFEEAADFGKHVLNQPSDASEFSVNRLGVRPGDRILDKRTQTEYEARRPPAQPTKRSRSSRFRRPGDLVLPAA